jgi:hypothetical protein
VVEHVLAGFPGPKEKKKKGRKENFWVQEAHIYHCSYSGGRDQEDWGLKPAWANSSQDSISKKQLKVEALSSNPSIAKKKKKKKKEKKMQISLQLLRTNYASTY